MSKTLFEKTKLSLIIILCSILYWIYMIPSLPDSIPMQVEDDGSVIWSANKYIAALLTIVIMTIIYLIMLYKPKYKNMDKGRRDAYENVYSIIINLVIFLVFVAILIVIFNANGFSFDMNRLILLITGTLLIVIGNYYQKIPFNSPIGIKTPWIVSSSKIWSKTHRTASIVFLLLGFVIFLSGLIYPSLEKYVFIIIVIGFLIPLLYSFYLTHQD
ncbi:SdpI family protein [Macrococcus equipercicus]|uniref:SdpI family protein n=1 Tax=Macrococcus equipercicus TaxID=69967 RepID=A0A9Q9BUH8_9STAP|nr:SdpI family protein [Macrococcus equipercicus]KAA1039886.1 SdpI family protein [Macrococcus equipercicus]UTH13163.1 SdpI family protein [Macrococcus equipercicus]